MTPKIKALLATVISLTLIYVAVVLSGMFPIFSICLALSVTVYCCYRIFLNVYDKEK